MRSQLALPAPAPRHPFRQSLAAPAPMRPERDDEGDLKLFVLSFTAFFVCFYTFIF